MECRVQDRIVDTCPALFQPVANKAVIAFTTRTTFYLQSLLVFFNGSVAAGLHPPNHAVSLSDRRRMTIRNRQEADANKLNLRRKAGMDALNILIAMNVAMSCTSLVLAFAPRHTLDFHSALVVVYLLVLSWFAIVSVVPFYIRLKVSIHDMVLKSAVLFQSILVFIYILALLARANTFGPSFCCNDTARGYFFGSFSALGRGRTIGWVLVGVMIVAYATYATGLHECVRATKRRTTKAENTATDNSNEKSRRGGSSRLQSLGDSLSAEKAIELVEGIDDDADKAEDFSPIEMVAREAGVSSETQQEIEEAEAVIKAIGSANMKLFLLYFIIWLLAVINTEMLILRNGFAYDIRDDIAISMSDPVDFAQTLQFTQVLTFFIPFVHIHDTLQKIRATWLDLRESWRSKANRFRQRRSGDRRDNSRGTATAGNV